MQKNQTVENLQLSDGESKMIEFIESPEPFKPFRLRFWKRTYGSEFPSFEFFRIKEFYDAGKMKRPSVSGYVKRIDYQHFLLLPTLYTPFPLLCTCAEGVALPPENAYVNVEGQMRWTQLEMIAEREHVGKKEIVVEKWDMNSPEWLTQIKANLNFKEFKEEIFTRVLNVEPLVQDFIASQIVSCPQFENFVGGLNVCMYDATQKALSSPIIREIKQIVPQDIGKVHVINTPFGRVPLTYKYRLLQIDADKPLSQKVAKTMMNRTAPFPYDEISFCLGSRRNMPKTLEEPPCRLSDFPTILNEEVDIAKKKTDPSLEAFKYMQIQHLITPIVLNTADVISKAHEKTVKLQDRYDISPQLLARFSILDASYYGKPQSILRLALANARTEDKKKMSDNNLNYALEMFDKNFDHTYEVWSDLFTEAGLSTHARILLRLSPDERKIIKTIEKLQSTDKKCVNIDEIATNLPRLKRPWLEELIKDLGTRKGLIIETLPQCYRVILLE
jgi:hypothetical protein